MDIVDEVTGNANGSYWMNRIKAQEYIKDKLHIVKDAIKDGFMSVDNLDEPEIIDVVLRCYVFYDALLKALQEIKNI